MSTSVNWRTERGDQNSQRIPAGVGISVYGKETTVGGLWNNSLVTVSASNGQYQKVFKVYPNLLGDWSVWIDPQKDGLLTLHIKDHSAFAGSEQTVEIGIGNYGGAVSGIKESGSGLISDLSNTVKYIIIAGLVFGGIMIFKELKR